jgi:type VI secretion system secreted protein Hcp
MRTRVLGTVVVVALLALSASAAHAAVTMYLEVPGVPSLQGESAANGHQNQIDLRSYAWGVTKPTSATSTKPAFNNVSVDKNIDRASPALLEAVASGTTFPSAKLHVVSQIDPPIEFLTYCFTGVKFTSVQDKGEEETSEALSWTYQTVVEKYRQQDSTGAPTGTFTGGWDLVRNLQFGGACS